ncbi:MAG: flagellar hook assembly protein FlgD [Myxococcales bacterium]|nr:flagellar hook assembly protein FlgD [Myxococcales bacterium]
MSPLAGVYSADQQAALAAQSSGPTDELGKDAFLKLLTTQLQHQDPLNPMENAEFVAQLAQFSSLEQLQGLSDGMESLYLVNMSMNNAALTGLIGKDVVATGNEFHYPGTGDETVTYDASGAATASSITITNSDGEVVFTKDLGPMSAGDGAYTWDGKSLDGQACPEGDYSFSITATNAEGTEVEVTEQMTGRIDGMDLSSGSPLLTMDGISIELGSIQSLGEPTE